MTNDPMDPRLKARIAEELKHVDSPDIFMRARRYSDEPTGTYAPVPAGWSIIRQVHPTHADFDLMERNGATWPDGTPRSALTVTVYHERQEVSWPSTSDKRPVLARVLAIALLLAAAYAEDLS